MEAAEARRSSPEKEGGPLGTEASGGAGKASRKERG